MRVILVVARATGARRYTGRPSGSGSHDDSLRLVAARVADERLFYPDAARAVAVVARGGAQFGSSGIRPRLPYRQNFGREGRVEYRWKAEDALASEPDLGTNYPRQR